LAAAAAIHKRQAQAQLVNAHVMGQQVLMPNAMMGLGATPAVVPMCIHVRACVRVLACVDTGIVQL